MFSQKLNRPIALVAAAVVVGAGAYGIVGAAAGSDSGTATTALSSSATSGQPTAGGGGSNARSGPATGGSIGTVASMSRSSFTLTTSTGQRVTVKKVSSTKYKKGTRPTSASAVKKGETVLALGTTNGTSITASQIIVQPSGSAGSATSPTEVVPFQPGAPSTSKRVGQIPASYSQGSGTIVSGTKANRATEAALAAYSGGIVDRVVKLGTGDYEVHNIGVNWPHHIFVTQNFKVVGAE
jgi:hypothetical protein